MNGANDDEALHASVVSGRGQLIPINYLSASVLFVFEPTARGSSWEP
jgi:hypothetical protein